MLTFLGERQMQLKRLIENVEKIVRDPKYASLRRFWNEFYALTETKRIPLRITLTMAFFAKNLNINLIDHYQKPEKYIEDSLKIIAFQHNEILDDRTKNGIAINFGEGFESSLFGSNPIFRTHTDPWVGAPIIQTEKDLENLHYPDFYESGLMPKVLEVYDTAEKMMKDKIPVFFERWDRSPWGIAVHLRGLPGLLVDTYRNPDLVHKLLTFLTESRMRWEREKEKFLGVKTSSGFLSSDEVNAQVISPKIYQVFVHPYEQKLANFYPQGLFYFHSCGDITPFLDTLATIRGLRRIHISPATDFKTAVNKLGGEFVFQKRMHPITDLKLCDPKTLALKIQDVLQTGRNTSMELDPGPIQDESLAKIQTWIKIARKQTKSELQKHPRE